MNVSVTVHNAIVQDVTLWPMRHCASLLGFNVELAALVQEGVAQACIDRKP